MSGNAIDVIVKPTVVMAALASEKLRSRNNDNGTSGSRVLRRCQ